MRISHRRLSESPHVHILQTIELQERDTCYYIFWTALVILLINDRNEDAFLQRTVKPKSPSTLTRKRQQGSRPAVRITGYLAPTEKSTVLKLHCSLLDISLVSSMSDPIDAGLSLRSTAVAAGICANQNYPRDYRLSMPPGS